MKKILVVEDEPGIRQILDIHLRAAGFQAVCRETAGEGLRDIAGGGVSLAICDFKLPDMQGVEIIRAIREITADLPIIVISGFIDEDAVEEAETTRVEFLKKPFSKEALLCAIEAFLPGDPE